MGLVTGDLDQPLRRVLLAVDPAPAVVDEAVAWSADLLLTHHPLLLRGSTVSRRPPRRAAPSRRWSGEASRCTSRTPTPTWPTPGVDALAEVLGLVDTRPLRRSAPAATYKLVTFVPPADADRLVDALAAAGAGRIGGYDRCAWTTEGTDLPWRDLRTRPTVGEPGRVEWSPRCGSRWCCWCRRGWRHRCARAHPYEEPAYDLVALAPAEVARGTGAGRLHPGAARLRGGAGGAACHRRRVGRRRPGPLVGTVAVCGGRGDDLFAEVRASGADAFVTADLRHHPAAEALEHGAPALVDWAPTGRPSGRGWPRRSGCCARDWPSATRPRRIAWTPGSRRSSPTRGRPSEPTRRPAPGRPGARPESTRADQQRLLDVQTWTPASPSWPTGAPRCPSTPSSPTVAAPGRAARPLWSSRPRRATSSAS